MLDFERKQRYGKQHSEGNGYYYESAAMQMQHCPPPPPPPPRAPKMGLPNGYPHRNNGWSHLGHHGSGGEMWHVNGGRPNAAKFSQYGGGRFNAGGMMMEEVVEEESFYEMHYEHSNWGDHGIGMGPAPGHRRVGMNGYPKAGWVSKGL